jgi:predicted transcriptional regulator
MTTKEHPYELLKSLHYAPKTRMQIADDLDLSSTAVGRHLKMAMAHGMVIRYPGPHTPGKRGPDCFLHSIAPEWRRVPVVQSLTDAQCDDVIRQVGVWSLACVLPQNLAMLRALARAGFEAKGKA